MSALNRRLFNPGLQQIYGLGVEEQRIAIESIQTIGVLFDDDTSIDVTISYVDTTKSIIIFGGYQYPNTPANNSRVRASFIDGNTVRIQRQSTDTLMLNNAFTVVQFKDSVVDSVQHGEISFSSGTSATDTITSVDTARSVAVYSGVSGAVDVRLDLQNSTTVRARNAESSTNSRTVNYSVIEFNSNFVNSVQQESISIGSGNTEGSNTITQVETTASILFYQGQTRTAGTINPSATRAFVSLPDAVTVKAERNTSDTTTVTVNVTVVEFNRAFIRRKQTGTSTIAAGSDTTATIPISDIKVEKSFVSYLGHKTTSDNTVDNRDGGLRLYLEISNVILERFVNQDNGTTTAYWQIIEFN